MLLLPAAAFGLTELLLLFSFQGDLIPRHQQVFSTNQFFSGVRIPDPESMVSAPSWPASHNVLSVQARGLGLLEGIGRFFLPCSTPPHPKRQPEHDGHSALPGSRQCAKRTCRLLNTALLVHIYRCSASRWKCGRNGVESCSQKVLRLMPNLAVWTRLSRNH